MIFKVGQLIKYVSYGAVKFARIVKITNQGTILLLDNKRWTSIASAEVAE